MSGFNRRSASGVYIGGYGIRLWFGEGAAGIGVVSQRTEDGGRKSEDGGQSITIMRLAVARATLAAPRVADPFVLVVRENQVPLVGSADYWGSGSSYSNHNRH